MAIFFGFAPWIVYWVLVGNVPFIVAAVVALAIAVAALVVGRYQGAPGRSLEIGAVATFVVLTVLTLTVRDSCTGQWLLALSCLGIFVVTLAGAVSGRPFLREFAVVGQPAHVVESEGFVNATARLTWMWVAAFAGMTVSSAIPPLVGDATFTGSDDPVAVGFYWVIPQVLLIAAVFAARIRPDRLAEGADDAVRKTSFVAYSEAAIDELYYLAQEHANREVGAGQEAYNVKVGGSGLPLVGDESRQSWPATYKVRASRR